MTASSYMFISLQGTQKELKMVECMEKHNNVQ